MQIMQEQLSALPITAKEGGNAGRLLGTISAIHVGNAAMEENMNRAKVSQSLFNFFKRLVLRHNKMWLEY